MKVGGPMSKSADGVADAAPYREHPRGRHGCGPGQHDAPCFPAPFPLPVRVTKAAEDCTHHVGQDPMGCMSVRRIEPSGWNQENINANPTMSRESVVCLVSVVGYQIGFKEREEASRQKQTSKQAAALDRGSRLEGRRMACAMQCHVLHLALETYRHALHGTQANATRRVVIPTYLDSGALFLRFSFLFFLVAGWGIRDRPSWLTHTYIPLPFACTTHSLGYLSGAVAVRRKIRPIHPPAELLAQRAWRLCQRHACRIAAKCKLEGDLTFKGPEAGTIPGQIASVPCPLCARLIGSGNVQLSRTGWKCFVLQRCRRQAVLTATTWNDAGLISLPR
ncbi:hypothetical protein B0T19DRAFT_195599 [Cercophora scortea]|uniref:Uncharacterized protein n=1 Tax=Cercophora scortea TaxID=314031 RepID=A0AAE0IP85_9PEZI|nr:hypothetical protein B0T19DRAFT_195599 [Cercophora scortea]